MFKSSRLLVARWRIVRGMVQVLENENCPAAAFLYFLGATASASVLMAAILPMAWIAAFSAR